MKINLHIPKPFLIRLGLCVAIFAAAYAVGTFWGDRFPSFHQQHSDEPASQDNTTSVSFYFYNPGNSFKLNNLPSKFLSDRLFMATQSKFSEIGRNHRDNLLFKTEKEIPVPPLLERIHYSTFITHHYSSPDDFPPAV